MSSPPLSPRPVFDPDAGTPPNAGNGAGWRAAPRVLLAYYRDPVSWLALGVTSVMLCYVGGLIMFWFHAVELGEGGPAISWYSHWLLDSTFGFIALTPPLALIMPFAISTGSAIAGAARPHVLLWSYAIIAGGLFSLVTAPGPIVHDMLVGRGTWIAERVTGLIGDPSAQLAPAQEYPASAALTQQLGAAVAIYLLLTLAAALSVRALLVTLRRRTAARVALAGPAGAADPTGRARSVDAAEPAGRVADGPGMRVR